MIFEDMNLKGDTKPTQLKQLTAEVLDEYNVWDKLTPNEQKEWKTYQKKTLQIPQLFDYFGLNNCNRKFYVDGYDSIKIYTVEKSFPCT